MRNLHRRLAAALAVVAAAFLLAPSTDAARASTAAPSSPPTPSSSSSSTAPVVPGTSPSSTTGSSTQASHNLSFGIGPALPVPSTQIVDGRPYLNFLATPGGTIHDAVAVFNVGTKPVRLAIYAADATDSETGDFTLLSQSAPRTDAASWIRLQLPKSGMITVPPRHGNHYGRVVVPFTARIPDGATPGDHAAGIIASLSSVSKDKQGARIRFNQRIGVRAYFQLAGAVTPRLAIRHLRVHYARAVNLRGKGDVSLSYVLQNTGNLRLSVSTLASIDRWWGPTIHAYPPGIPDLLPGGKVRMTQTIPDVGGFGKMTARVTAFGSPVDTTVSQKAPPASATATFWVWTWLDVAVVLLLLLLSCAGGGWWWRRHRRKARALAAKAAGAARGKTHKTPALTPRSTSTT